MQHSSRQEKAQEGTSMASLTTSLASSDLDDSKSPCIPSDVLQRLARDGLVVDNTGVVTFSLLSSSHPRQWYLRRKIFDTSVIFLLEFLTTAVSNSGSNASTYAYEELGISRELAIFCLSTVYLLGQAVGGLTLPPFAEAFGGKLIYVASSLVYAAMCLMIGLAPSVATVTTGRLVQGLMSAMPTVVAIGSVENMWSSEQRIWVVDAFAIAGFFGMALGPIFAVFVADSSLEWHWIFIIAAILVAINGIVAIAMRESKPASALRHRIGDIVKKTGYSDLRAPDDATFPGMREFMQTSFALPVRLFLTDPIVCLTAVMGATVGSIFYLFSEALPVVYSSSSGFRYSERDGSLVFVILAVGTLFSLLPRWRDLHITRQRKRKHQPVEPEDKLFGFLIGTPILALAFWWFSGTIPPLVTKVTPALSMLALFPIGFVVVEFDYVLTGYLTDNYASHSASANAPLCFLRAILSGVYPLFGRTMFESLGANIATFILAAITTLYCGVAYVFWRHGAKIRRKSQFAEQLG